MFTLKLGDIFRGLVVAILTGAFIAILGIIGAEDFDVFVADWYAIGKTMVNGGFAAFVGYLVKNLITDNSGRIMGKF